MIDLLKKRGYTVRIENRPAYRGHPDAKDIYFAIRNGQEFFAARDLPHYELIQRIQASIPHVAKIVDRFDGIALFEKVDGDLLWDLDSPPDCGPVEEQLLEFADAVRAHGIVHADIRPWNVIWGEDSEIRVIDWGFPYIQAMSRWEEHIVKHMRACSPQVLISEIMEIDRVDISKLVRLMRGEIGLNAAWRYGAGSFSWVPQWCRR